MKNPLKIGFDLDGVLLYNPARVFRPISIVIKKILKHRESVRTDFYYPKSNIEKAIWVLIHKSSISISEGYNMIGQLVKEDKIEAYIVTSRYDCLKNDLNEWLKKMKAHEIFKGIYHNEKNLQPHIFKAQKINKLRLQYFVEDNFDIVQYINKNTHAKCLWISNAFDKSISYNEKFMSLKEALKSIKQKIVF